MIKSNRGFALPGVILMLAVLLVFIPAFIKLLDKESKDTVAENKKSIGLQLAEAGQDRGAWKLRESDAIWANAVGGTTVSGYEGTTIHNDVAGGQYKISFSPGPGPGDVTVISKGRANGTTGIRAIRAVYSKNSVLGAMNVNGGLTYRPNLRVHWGPVVTYTSIDQAPSQFYPRKFSAGQIVGRDTTNDNNNGAMPAEDWATYDYAAFYDLGTPPVIDLSAYRTRAIASSVPLLRKGTGTGAAAQDVAQVGSGRYTGDVKIENASGFGDYTFSNSTSVIFVEGEVKRFPLGAFLDVEALIVMSHTDINAAGTTYNATLPGTASKEYQHSSLGGFFTGEGWADGAVWPIPDCGMHGFLYVGGDLTNAGGGATICGTIFVAGTVSVNTVTVYYDQSVSNGIRVNNASLTRTSWDEILTGW